MSKLSNLTGKTVALMGGAGFIGHNLALHLKSLGAVPHVIDGLQVNSIGSLISDTHKVANKALYIEFINERLNLLQKKEIPIEVLDIRDYGLVSKTLDKIKPDCIVHLAAIAHANRSNKDPYSTYDHSLRTLENVLDNCKTSGTHLIYFSSSMVYGDFNGAAAVEDQQCNPLGIYGALKLAAEKIIIGYNQVFGVPYTIIRPSALYGERCVSRRVGQAFIENAMQGFDLTINGDGKDELDFTYIEDLVQGVVRCVAIDAARNQIFNITHGNGRAVGELANLVMREFPDTKLVFNARDSLMPERGTLSIDKARDMIGYAPKFPIETGVKKYIEWYKSFGV